MAMPKSPRPGMGTLAAAVTGGQSGFSRRTGLFIQIDPNHTFVTGTVIAANRIDRLGMSFTSFKEPLRTSLNTVIVPSIIKNFAAQGRPRWKSLTKSTTQDRLRKGYPRGPILQRTGRLRREAVKKNIWEIRPIAGSKGADILRLRTNYFTQKVPYAEFHQRGAGSSSFRTVGGLSASVGTDRASEIMLTAGTRSDSRLPARPYIQLTTGEEVEIYNIFVAFMGEKVNKYWGPGSGRT